MPPLRCQRAIDIVEASYSLEGDRTSWLDRITASAHEDLDRGAGVIAYIADSATMTMGAVATKFVTPGLLAMLTKLNESAPTAVKENFRRVSSGFYSVHDTFRTHHELIAFWAETITPLGFADGVGVHAPGGGETLTLWAPSPTQDRHARQTKAMWTQVGAHLSSGLRLRRALGDRPDEQRAEAILGVDGKVKHAHGDAAPSDVRDALRGAVRSIERARGPLRKRDPEAALALWSGLVRGRWSLVDYWDTDGHRFFAAHPNMPASVDPRKLREREIAALSLSIEGASPKEVAYALGISASNARAVIASGVRKLQLRSRADLHRLALDNAHVHEVELENHTKVHVLEVAHRRASADVLSASELAVARLAAAGHSNADIATKRRVHIRTIANQMAAILKKLDIRSRAELGAFF